MARELGVSPKQRAAFRKALSDLEAEGKIVQGKKSRYRLPNTSSKSAPFTGRIEFSGRGKSSSAFFVPDEPEKIAALRNEERPRVFVPGRFTANALHGDRVAVRLTTRSAPKWHKYSRKHRERSRSRREDESPVGRVVDVLERSSQKIVGIYHRRGHSAVVAPEDSRLPNYFKLSEVMKQAKPNDLVVAEFVAWDSPQMPPVARMVEVLGRPDDPHVDMLAVIHRYGLPLEFPNRAQTEADIVEEEIPEEEIASREDWRDKEVFTIDPEDARDFDDAISVTELEGGGWELAVHIADVSHYVKPGSALDKEARKRGNSVYLADRVIPMLPEKLSNGVCSLNPHVERLTHAAIMTFGSTGTMKKVRFVRAVIRSGWRYTYEEAYNRMMLSDKAIDAFENPEERNYARHVKRAWKLGAVLRQRRLEAGAFDLDFPEVRIVLDKKGKPIGTKTEIYDESHQLIEEFMLAANEAVAKEIKNAKAPSIYRIHEDPDPSKLDEYADQARSLGFSCGDLTIRKELQKLLKSFKGKPEEENLKIGLLKSLRRAAYSNAPLGHYGLAKVNYTHFTSPIRRYADLVVHRALKRLMSRNREAFAEESPASTPNEQGMSDIAQHISKTERVAADAEMETRKLKMIEYLEILCREEEGKTFSALVTDLRPVGVFLELEELRTRGMIRKMDLPARGDYYFDRGQNKFKSRSSRHEIRPGDRIEVRLIRVDRSRGFVDFELVGG